MSPEPLEASFDMFRLPDAAAPGKGPAIGFITRANLDQSWDSSDESATIHGHTQHHATQEEALTVSESATQATQATQLLASSLPSKRPRVKRIVLKEIINEEATVRQPEALPDLSTQSESYHEEPAVFAVRPFISLHSTQESDVASLSLHHVASLLDSQPLFPEAQKLSQAVRVDAAEDVIAAHELNELPQQCVQINEVEVNGLSFCTPISIEKCCVWAQGKDILVAVLYQSKQVGASC
jgi:hypothetical protein